MVLVDEITDQIEAELQTLVENSLAFFTWGTGDSNASKTDTGMDLAIPDPGARVAIAWNWVGNIGTAEVVIHAPGSPLIYHPLTRLHEIGIYDNNADNTGFQFRANVHGLPLGLDSPYEYLKFIITVKVDFKQTY